MSKADSYQELGRGTLWVFPRDMIRQKYVNFGTIYVLTILYLYIYLISVSIYFTKTMKFKKKNDNHKNRTQKGIVFIETITRMKILNYNNSPIWKLNSYHVETSQVIL